MISEVPVISCPNWLRNLSADQILSNPFPLKQVLNDSLYYPSSGIDGDPIRHLAGNIFSFIYVDYGYTEDDLKNAILNRGFTGYQPVAVRPVREIELTPNGWIKMVVLTKEDGDPRSHQDFVKPSFCSWYVFERHPGFDARHGPCRFSLVHLCADGVAAFQALYVSNDMRPKAIAIIQPGEGFGGNWTYFWNPEQILARTVLRNPAGVPDWLLYGGYGAKENYSRPCWPQYSENICYLSKTEGGNLGNIGLWRRPLQPVCL